MATDRRVLRVNSLLKEVIADIIQKDIYNPDVSKFTSVTEVDISKDLRHAKVYISVIGNEEEKQKTVLALQSASGFIAQTLKKKKVVIPHLPELIFKIDRGIEHQIRIDTVLEKIHKEQQSRN